MVFSKAALELTGADGSIQPIPVPSEPEYRFSSFTAYRIIFDRVVRIVAFVGTTIRYESTGWLTPRRNSNDNTAVDRPVQKRTLLQHWRCCCFGKVILLE